ncbi:MAG: DUF2905 domain-containing protein [Endozoicomonas sp.]
MAKWFFLAALVLAVTGLILQFAPWIMGWFGRLPGDIHLRGDHYQIFISDVHGSAQSWYQPASAPVFSVNDPRS